MTVERLEERGADRGPSEVSEKGDTGLPGIDLDDTAAPLTDWSTSSASLAIWRREPPVDIREAIQRLPLERIKGWRRNFDAADARPRIYEAISECGITDERLTRFLSADMTLLALIFATGTATRRVEMRLEIVRNDACRKFHIDSYTERLAVTYRGPGTVAVPRCHGERALAEQNDYSGPVLEIPAFWVSLFAGEMPGRIGLVHRSPRVAGTGKARLFFCVNAARN